MGQSVQQIILTLQNFWASYGCIQLQPYDMEMGAGTFHPATVLWTLGPDPLNIAYVQPSRRPSDGRYGDNPNRLQKFHQFQVVLKPSPEDSQDLVLKSFDALGLEPDQHDIRFVEDDWESPTLGAAGLGWEVWYDGMEVLQFTYFQQVGGVTCSPIPVELTYGVERLAMCAQKRTNVYELDWNEPGSRFSRTYGQLFQRAEREFSTWYFEKTSAEELLRHFDEAHKQSQELLNSGLVLPAYEMCIRASHLFNMLDARGAIGVALRAHYIQRVRALACGCCSAWVEQTASAEGREGEVHV